VDKPAIASSRTPIDNKNVYVFTHGLGQQLCQNSKRIRLTVSNLMQKS